MINGYYTDNLIFNASKFMEYLLNNQQNIIFSGSGASHQNWSAERAINMVFTMSRTILIHAVLRCPEYTFSTDLCTI